MFTATYNHSQKQWTAIVSPLVSLPNTHPIELTAANRPELETAYLVAVAPQLGELAAKIAAKFPALADRARRAAISVAEGRVTIHATPVQILGRQTTSTELATVGSSNPDQPAYHITKNTDDFSKTLHCDCPDCHPTDGHAPTTRVSERTCYHIVAYMIAAELVK